MHPQSSRRPARLGAAVLSQTAAWRLWLTLACATGVASAPAAASVLLNEVATRIDRTDLPQVLDETGTPRGFVELLNDGEVGVDLAGWSIRADSGAGVSWTLPAVQIDAGGLLRVWMSERNRSNPTKPLHATFSLAGADSVSLHDDSGALVDEVPLAIPIDRSYGRCGDDWYYFDPPSPGAPNAAIDQARVVSLPSRLSLTVGRPHQMVSLPNPSALWSVLGTDVDATVDGSVTAPGDIAPGALPNVLLAADPATGGVDFVPATVVDWPANVSALELISTPSVGKILGSSDTGVYFVSGGTTLNHSTDGLVTGTTLGTLPAPTGSPAELHTTPFGFLYRSAESLYHSPDLVTWSHAFSADLIGLQSGFAWHWDESSQTGTVLMAEYSVITSERHAVHLGTFDAQGASSWQTAVEFSSIDEGVADPTLLDVARHVHVVAIDPETGDRWVNTGDNNAHARTIVAKAGTTSFQVLGSGSQEWRSLAIWFTATHVYWNMDTSASQSIWRIDRSHYDPVSGWPSMTPDLDSGMTTLGVTYRVLEDVSGTRFPVGIGDTFVESTPRTIDAAHRVRPLDDPVYDYREEVLKLDVGAHWFQIWVEDEGGDSVALMATSAGGNWRDSAGRVFGIKERADGSVDIQELFSIEPDPPWSELVQLQPITQDPLGYIYFNGIDTSQLRYKMKLEWKDDDGGPTGGPTAASGAIPPPDPALCEVPEPSAVLAQGSGLALLMVLRRHRLRRARRPGRRGAP